MQRQTDRYKDSISGINVDGDNSSGNRILGAQEKSDDHGLEDAKLECRRVQENYGELRGDEEEFKVPRKDIESTPSRHLTASVNSNYLHKEHEKYPAWNPPEEVPISRIDIEAIFIELQDIFGFQHDNTRNMFDYFMVLLDSRASRLGPKDALMSLHADYIGGINSNFRKWFFAAQLDKDDFPELGIDKRNGILDLRKSHSSNNSLKEAENQWCINMSALLPADWVIQVALYLLCWGEACNIRFMPECLCFIFKCCNDYYYSLDIDSPTENATPSFLKHAITPLYNFYRDQSYIYRDGIYHHVEKDHKYIIGYDDMNQLFWYRKGLERIILRDGETKLMSLPSNKRYIYLNQVLWDNVFYKTFKERRGWFHVFASFNRIWIVHLSVFWYFTSFNSPTLYTYNYRQILDNQPTIQARLSIMSMAGAIATIICLVSVLLELSFVPRKWEGAQPILMRTVLLTCMLVLNIGPSFYLFLSFPLFSQSNMGLSISIFQFVFSVFSVVYLSLTPLGNLFGTYMRSSDRRFLAAKNFAACFQSLNTTDRIASCGLWITIFATKFIESYFFLTLSLKEPIRELSILKIDGCVDEYLIGKWICIHYATITLVMIILTDLVLFFLDTYLWYIFWNTTYSVVRSFYSGFSIWTPWRNIFARLPKRIFSKIIASANNRDIKAKVLVSQVWNYIIISMYREHFLSLEHVQKLIYKEIVVDEKTAEKSLQEPMFFVSQDVQSMKSSFFSVQSEAQRRIIFFAQSLSTPMADTMSTSSMPTFSVLVPHYKEKIALSLRELVREEADYSHITMLEYLKQLHPLEWVCFVQDTKMLSEENNADKKIDLCLPKQLDPLDDISYYSVGFKTATPEYVLRTRIWASLRSQTLYRTISGFMNYSRAIKLLFDVENPDAQGFDNKYAKLEEASVMALRKFHLLVSMQRFKYFNLQEKEDKEFLLRAFPELKIAYLDEEKDQETGELKYYSVLIDGSCPIMADGVRKPRYRIQLSGNPILGDGKSDNQNHSLVFCRGEYIQLVDANQDNYLEECLKIRNVLAEFEETSVPLDPYSRNVKENIYSNPVAIIGTREYIFSENIGILGDVAAGKEQTFGTLFARTLSHIGGKLHYGHPDFLNNIFMTTRGGVSKAQKGLHLNEDIYAGMNVILRGGRIKHCEYMQCGKGRDLGFNSILNFTTKIGAGMGEQMLSREYFYLNSQLPLDRFLSIYYAHPGFHLNNVFIILSIKLFLLVGASLAALTTRATICEYNRHALNTDIRYPIGCYNLRPIIYWLERCIYSIFIVFTVSFMPLWVQEQTERGLYKAFTRIGKHLVSFSPLFEIFVCRVYAYSLASDIARGGARYISTGRSFATIRVPFSNLYSRFASESLYYGSMCGLLILYSSLEMWTAPLLFFWVITIGLVFSPFLYNPNQFSLKEFLLDYRNYLKWLHGGNSRYRASSWINFTKLKRGRITGFKHLETKDQQNINFNDIKPSRWNSTTSQSSLKQFEIFFLGCVYMFACSNGGFTSSTRGGGILRIAFLSLGPIVVNMVILLVFFIISCVTGTLGTLILRKFPAILAALVHILAVLNHIIFFEIFWFLHSWKFSLTVLGAAYSIVIHSWVLQCVSTIILSREFRNDKPNRAWWSGKWLSVDLALNPFTQPLREFVCKTVELSYFACDVIIGHIIIFVQTPIIIIPYINKVHTLMLFWLKSGDQFRPRMLSKNRRRILRGRVMSSAIVYLLTLFLFASTILLPLVATKYFKIEIEQHLPDYIFTSVKPLMIAK